MKMTYRKKWKISRLFSHWLQIRMVVEESNKNTLSYSSLTFRSFLICVTIELTIARKFRMYGKF